ncbi:DUF3524 domain-containing protein [Pseudomaricurvus sp. HS19]|uniref:tRNA-queuosine alpha-mannosyltransferase domain-containing protein n=1 Tax=Pseudomaricurvus sp. HS19 TaxID=2692626 RepID=UPI00136D6F46|nr:DUF3524 domain-containing protein [Pseudomaricurvus sp. HS19]MYM62556.1 DUF3524 domain-containing protein [Pseudomaricurvus sp. HS19]
MTRVLLLSAYDAESHRYWRRGLVEAFPEWQWQELTLPPRYFSWRIRGNSLSWAFSARELLEQPYDLLITTSMTDLAALRGFVPQLAVIPTLVYFHENQFAYPVTDSARADVAPQIGNLYTALCADRVVFNSAWNRDTFLHGVRQLLQKLPDQVPVGLPDRLASRSCVLPVPLRDRPLREKPLEEEPAVEESGVDWRDNGQARRLLWVARWEYDKGPGLLLQIVRELQRRQVNFRLCLLGQQFRQQPVEFAEVCALAGDYLVQAGYEPDVHHYRAWLASGDVVFSTAEHEFQGIAVQEAMAAGCLPLLPDRLAYPEWVSREFLYPVEGLDLEQQASAAVDRLLVLTAPGATVEAPDTTQWLWRQQKTAYQRVFDQLLPRDGV